MTESATAGESVLTQPGAVEEGSDGTGKPESTTKEAVDAAIAYTVSSPLAYEGASTDPLNAAIAATAGETQPSDLPRGPLMLTASDEDRMAAVESHIAAGVAKAMASVGNAEIVTVAAFKAGIEALLRHLHFDHPENYLPKE